MPAPAATGTERPPRALERMMAEANAREVQLPPHDGQGLLRLPSGRPNGLVLFAHGSGSSRLSPRNSRVAEALRQAGLASLLFDLLTDRESADRKLVFDIALLAERLGAATDWAAARGDLGALPIGYFGASTGAAAALVAAAGRQGAVRVVVSRGGRPDLADAALPRVAAPTLLIVGGADTDVLALNRQAYGRLRCERRLSVVPGAGHLFEEPGTLDQVIALAREWFVARLAAEAPHAVP